MSEERRVGKDGRKHGVLNLVFPSHYDFYGMLRLQAEQTAIGVQALVEWLDSGDGTEPNKLIIEEEKGDQMRLEMEQQLSEAFSTPFDRQDIYSISRQMDHIINFSLSTAYEIRAFGVRPDDAVKGMAGSLQKGAQLVARCIGMLETEPAEAEKMIRQLRTYEHEIEKTYVNSMAAVFVTGDAISAMKKREVYHHLKDAGRNLSITVDILHRIIVGLS